jgi:hypothetical protein
LDAVMTKCRLFQIDVLRLLVDPYPNSFVSSSSLPYSWLTVSSFARSLMHVRI